MAQVMGSLVYICEWKPSCSWKKRSLFRLLNTKIKQVSSVIFCFVLFIANIFLVLELYFFALPFVSLYKP